MVNPLVPTEVDLRDFAFMPLDIRRLLTSETWIEASEEPKLAHALISLWCESWHQVPAASLPDNDIVLARLAMCDKATWLQIKEKALSGFVKCSDGRYYHPVVAEKALEAWERKQAQREKTRKATEARRNGKRDVNRDDTRNVVLDVHQGTVDRDSRQGQENISIPDGMDGGSTPAAPTCPHDDIVAAYHELLPTCPQVREWHKTRQGLLKSRWREDPKRQTLEWWRKYFAYVAESDFLTGRAEPRKGSPPFVATLEWLLRPTNFANVREGKYHNAG